MIKLRRPSTEFHVLFWTMSFFHYRHLFVVSTEHVLRRSCPLLGSWWSCWCWVLESKWPSFRVESLTWIVDTASFPSELWHGFLVDAIRRDSHEDRKVYLRFDVDVVLKLDRRVLMIDTFLHIDVKSLCLSLFLFPIPSSTKNILVSYFQSNFFDTVYRAAFVLSTSAIPYPFPRETTSFL